VAVKDLLNKLDSDHFEVRSNSVKLCADLRAGYIMNSRLTGVEEADFLLMVGSNPRWEAPVFNSRVMRAVRDNNLKVALIGTPHELTYPYLHLGASPSVL
jgi:NADH dehydrogenase (ubiquinone) Fe-S protein 1